MKNVMRETTNISMFLIATNSRLFFRTCACSIRVKPTVISKMKQVEVMVQAEVILSFMPISPLDNILTYSALLRLIFYLN